MAKQLNLIYALQNGSIVNISDVESGLKCNCVCPACGERLVAKKGNKMMHHFAHYSDANCAYGYESSLWNCQEKCSLKNAQSFLTGSATSETSRSVAEGGFRSRRGPPDYAAFSVCILRYTAGGRPSGLLV
ncbi:MAG: hypothetical protein IIT86_11670 [Oscillospiraceae bacterium]|nr:hypothetical protein [Oscillospiraceae bacterium]